MPLGNHFRKAVFAGHALGKPLPKSGFCRPCPWEALENHFRKVVFAGHALGQPLSKSDFCRPCPWEAPGKPLSKSGFCKPCPWETSFEKWFLQAVPLGNHFRKVVFAGHAPGKSLGNHFRKVPLLGFKLKPKSLENYSRPSKDHPQTHKSRI